jgi:polyhydroxybutyrate depolymerase
MKKQFLAVLLLLSTLSFSQTGTSTDVTISVGGTNRTYRIYVPAIYDGSKPVPLMLNIHGFTITMAQQEAYLDYRKIADTANFITVAPQGTSNDWNQSGTVSAGQADRDFLWAMIDQIKANYNINPCRIYTSGFSKGGFMSYILSINVDNPTRAPVIAAMGSVAGGISDNQGTTGYWQSKNPTHPTPIMEIHGTSDNTISYTGPSSGQGNVAVSTLVDYWVNFNTCNTTPVQTNFSNVTEGTSSTVEHYVYSGGKRGSSVELYKIISGGHTVPQNPAPASQRGVGTQNQDFNSALVIWQFCSKYCLPYLTSTTCTEYYSMYWR